MGKKKQAKRHKKVVEQAYADTMDHLSRLYELLAEAAELSGEESPYLSARAQTYWHAYQAVGAAFCDEMDALESKKK